MEKYLTRYQRSDPQSFFSISDEIRLAKKTSEPLVALESTVITHGLPFPVNLELAKNMENAVRENAAIPATIALMGGKIKVGLSAEEMEILAQSDNAIKVSVRDLGLALAKSQLGGTTVAATMFAAEQQGIKVFATGGIGGVHRGAPFDISADLIQLGRSQVVVVCAGAKAILDLPATLETLETQGVPVIGYQTDTLPAFWASDSGLKLTARSDSLEEIARIAEAHWDLGLQSGVLVVVPPPQEEAIPYDIMDAWIEQAQASAEENHISGNAVTPFLLSKVSELSGGLSMKVNLALLLNNARVAARIAKEMRPRPLPQRYLL